VYALFLNSDSMLPCWCDSETTLCNPDYTYRCFITCSGHISSIADDEKHAVDLYETDGNVTAVSNEVYEVHFHLPPICFPWRSNILGIFSSSKNFLSAATCSLFEMMKQKCCQIKPCVSLGVSYVVFPHTLTAEHIFVVRNRKASSCTIV